MAISHTRPFLTTEALSIFAWWSFYTNRIRFQSHELWTHHFFNTFMQCMMTNTHFALGAYRSNSLLVACLKPSGTCFHDGSSWEGKITRFVMKVCKPDRAVTVLTTLSLFHWGNKNQVALLVYFIWQYNGPYSLLNNYTPYSTHIFRQRAVESANKPSNNNNKNEQIWMVKEGCHQVLCNVVL